MKAKNRTSPENSDNAVKITVTENGPLTVTGGVPLTVEEICDDDDGYCRTWKRVRTFPVRERYELCRCGNSKNKPFCDGSHAGVHFDGTESGDHEPYREGADVIRGPELMLTDNEHLCVHARFCMRAGGIWNLVRQSGIPEARDTAIEEGCNCPSGRLVVHDRTSGKPIEPDLEKSIGIIEYPPRNEHGPIWVRGGIPVISADEKPYEIRNRVTLCRCGRSDNKPFCDGSHIENPR